MIMDPFLMRQRVLLASSVIEDFSFDHSGYSYRHGANYHDWSINGQGLIICKDQAEGLSLRVNFNGAANCIVFLGNDVRGSASILFAPHSHHSVVWIGDHARLNQLQIKCMQDYDFVAIGNGLSNTHRATLVSGVGASAVRPSIIIGDDCMFSYDVVIRNSDGHPIVSLKNQFQLNMPLGSVVIEPHVWLGERTAVLKDVRIGACSVIGFGSVVSRDIPRFSIATGCPARMTSQDPDKIWTRSMSEQDILAAKRYVNAHLPG
jgi:acetyltransferase-like isoleucine patch superfamily enzyme